MLCGIWRRSRGSSGNLMLERLYLLEISATAPESLLKTGVDARLARSYFESDNFETAINLLNGQQSAVGVQTQAKDKEQRTKNERLFRENLVLLGESYLQTGKSNEAREIFNKLINDLPNPAQPDDFALAAVKGLDLARRRAGKFRQNRAANCRKPNISNAL